MTSYRKREIVTRRVEYGVESGTEIGEFLKVKDMAFRDYCTRNGLSPDSSIAYSDGWARVEARDDEVVIWFAVDTEQPGGTDVR